MLPQLPLLLALPLFGSGIVSELIVVALIALVLFIVMKLAKLFLRLVFGIIINSILGVMLLFILNYLFGLGITLTWAVFVPIAIFGLPATGTIVLLKVLGATLTVLL